MNHMKKIVPLIRKICKIAEELGAHTQRPFTPDGHMVGSIGEVFAAHDYGLELLPPSTKTNDAKSHNGDRVQIKATFGDRGVALSSCPRRLLVLKLANNGTYEEVFNGPGALAWRSAGKRQKNGQRQISLTKLKKIMSSVPASEKLERISLGNRTK